MRDPAGPGMEPTSPALTGGFFTPEPPGKTPPAKILSSAKLQERRVNFQTVKVAESLLSCTLSPEAPRGSNPQKRR